MHYCHIESFYYKVIISFPEEGVTNKAIRLFGHVGITINTLGLENHYSISHTMWMGDSLLLPCPWVIFYLQRRIVKWISLIIGECSLYFNISSFFFLLAKPPKYSITIALFMHRSSIISRCGVKILYGFLPLLMFHNFIVTISCISCDLNELHYSSLKVTDQFSI